MKSVSEVDVKILLKQMAQYGAVLASIEETVKVGDKISEVQEKSLNIFSTFFYRHVPDVKD